MRYQLPDGQTSISAAGREFTADEDGIVVVPDDAGIDVHRAIQSPHGHALVALPGSDDEATGGTLAPRNQTPAERRRAMAALLRGYGVEVDGRNSLPLLRSKLIEVLMAEARRPPESESAAGAAQPASAPAGEAAQAPAP